VLVHQHRKTQDPMFKIRTWGTLRLALAYGLLSVEKGRRVGFRVERNHVVDLFAGADKANR
jgi:hypothetical protein